MHFFKVLALRVCPNRSLWEWENVQAICGILKSWLDEELCNRVFSFVRKNLLIISMIFILFRIYSISHSCFLFCSFSFQMQRLLYLWVCLCHKWSLLWKGHRRQLTEIGWTEDEVGVCNVLLLIYIFCLEDVFPDAELPFL